MKVLTLVLAVLVTPPSTTTTAAADRNTYTSGDYNNAINRASGGGGVSYRTGRGGVGGGGVPQGGSVPLLDRFGSGIGAWQGDGAFQRGAAQVQERDRWITRGQEQANHKSRQYDNADARAGRRDNQQRKGQLKDNAYNNQDQQARGSRSKQSSSYDQNFDKATENGRKQTDARDKHAGGLQSNGRYHRNDQAANAGKKALSASKNAFNDLNKGFDKIDYGFKKDFRTNVDERGGFKESVGQDNTHSDVFVVNQKDNRLSKGFQDLFRNADGNSASRKESDWLSNAAQAQNVNNQFGAADRLRNEAGQKNADFNSLSDRRNDVFWHRDSAKDQALRLANDEAQKKADQQKSAVAEASGKKGVQDSKYYGGGSYGPATGTGTNIAGHSGAGSHSGTVGGFYGNTASGPVHSGSRLAGTGTGTGTPGKVKGREEGSGGTYLNQYGEAARQADKGGQLEASNAQSGAKAFNDYDRGSAVDDSAELKGQRQGKWSKDQSGLRDAFAQGFNGADAGAAKKSALADRGLDQKSSKSNLDFSNKNGLAQALDRVNYKKNEVDTNQNVRKLKKFYHDKVEDGHNNEALKFNRNKGNQQTGEEQQAHKEARTSYNNAADDAKVNQQGRVYDNLDAKQITTADAFSKEKDNQGGWKNANQHSQDQAQKNTASIDKGRQNSEFDSFAHSVANAKQQLWDKARDDQATQDKGSKKDRSLDAFFQFGPRTANNDPLGLRSGQSSGGSPISGRTSFGSSRVPASTSSGSKFGGSSFGDSGFGGSKFGGSTFGGGMDSPSASWMDDIGSTRFGQSSFGQHGPGPSAFSGSSGRQWRRK